MDKNTYKKYANARAKKTASAKNCGMAFLSGGMICAAAEGIKSAYMMLTEEKTAGTLTSVTLIFIASLLTGLGVFDKIAKHAGAGTLVPITGFSNAVSSSALDAKSEGFVLGVGAKIFTIAGPVILYGITAGAVYGIILYFFT